MGWGNTAEFDGSSITVEVTGNGKSISCGNSSHCPGGILGIPVLIFDPLIYNIIGKSEEERATYTEAVRVRCVGTKKGLERISYSRRRSPIIRGNKINKPLNL